MIRIDTTKLEEGLMVTGRNPKTLQARLIRSGVHSFTNHNAMVVKPDNTWGIAEAVTPFSKVTSIDDYEKIMNDMKYLVRFYRLKTLTWEQRKDSADYFVKYLLNLPYPKKSRMVLLAMPIYNVLVDKTGRVPSIRMNWCSQLVKRAYIEQDPDCLDGIDGKKKELFTPKTFENRIMFGIFEDVTDSILVTKEK